MNSGMRRAHTIQAALPIVAKAIGRRMDVEVAIGGKSASTDGKTILLPTLPFEDPDVEVLAFGFLEHEAAHVRYTEPVPCSSRENRLRQIFEDIRIEKALGSEYPGFAGNLKQLVSKLVELGRLTPPSAESVPVEKLEKYLLYRMRSEVLKQDALDGHAVTAEALFRRAFPRAACVRIGAAIARVSALQSNRDSLNLAREIVSIIEEESQDPPPPAPSPDDAASENAADSSTDSAAGDGPPSAEGADVTIQEAEQREQLRAVLASDHAGVEGIGEVAAQALQEKAHQAVASTGGAGVGRAETALFEPSIDPVSVLLEVAEATTALRMRLRSFVESSRRTRPVYRRQGARTDDRRFVKAMLGDPRIFRQKREAPEVNTAVGLLVDRSGSMDDTSLRLALDAALACAASMNQIHGVSVMVGVFPGIDSDVEVLTHFHENLNRTANRYRGVSSSGGTPLLPALMWSAAELDARGEPRKMLLVFTDGRPFEFDRCQDVIARCWRGDIEVCGIGIKVPDISTLFPVSRSIQNMSELAPAMFTLLQDAMTRKRSA